MEEDCIFDNEAAMASWKFAGAGVGLACEVGIDLSFPFVEVDVVDGFAELGVVVVGGRGPPIPNAAISCCNSFESAPPPPSAPPPAPFFINSSIAFLNSSSSKSPSSPPSSPSNPGIPPPPDMASKRAFMPCSRSCEIAGSNSSEGKASSSGSGKEVGGREGVGFEGGGAEVEVEKEEGFEGFEVEEEVEVGLN